MRPSLVLALFISGALTKSANADGFIYQLPKDGSSVTFECTGEFNGVAEKDFLTISSVGETTIDGEKCRWIEFKTFHGEAEDRDDHLIWKLLIPERQLGKGKTAREHVIRGWNKFGQKGLKELKDAEAVKRNMMSTNQSLRPFLGGPSDEQKQLRTKEIDSKLGKLACDGVSGTYEFEEDGQTVTYQFENRLHDKAPFGLVASAWKITATAMGRSVQGTFNYRLIETSADAKSELPDRN